MLDGSVAIAAARRWAMPGTGPVAGITPFPPLLRWLIEHDVDHEVHEHQETIRARATARAEGIDPRRFAKTIVLIADERPTLVVVDALDRVDLEKAAAFLEAGTVRLATEDELVALAPACEVGTIPPIGGLFGLTVTADHAIHDDPEISFHAGSHRFTMHVDRPAWERAAHIVYADLAEAADRPAWGDL
jgi:Ala-tRNA(Pro) deacylase